MAVGRIFDRVPAAVRVILARWFIYVFATLPGLIALQGHLGDTAVSYTHQTLPTKESRCRSRWSPDH